MCSFLEQATEIVQNQSTDNTSAFIIAGITIPPAVIGVFCYVITLLSKRFPSIRTFMELVCKTLFGVGDCNKNKRKSKKMKTNKK